MCFLCVSAESVNSFASKRKKRISLNYVESPVSSRWDLIVYDVCVRRWMYESVNVVFCAPFLCIPSDFLWPIWFSLFDFLLWLSQYIRFDRLFLKLFLLYRYISRRLNSRRNRLERRKTMHNGRRDESKSIRMFFMSHTYIYINMSTEIETKCVRVTWYNWNFITLMFICVYFRSNVRLMERLLFFSWYSLNQNLL